MGEVTVTINGAQLSGRDDTTILELAKTRGIDIPTLCYISELLPTGSCRLCIVEVEGSRTLVASCHTPIAQGMVIQTHSPKVLQARRVIVELLLSSHCGTCYMCDKANICELRKIAADLEVGIPRFELRKRYYQIEDNSHIRRDLSKCVLCRKCVRVCSEIAKKNIFAIGYRGFDSKIIVDSDQPLDKDACRDCDICVSYCPTGSLIRKKVPGQEKKKKPLIISK